MRTLNDPDDFEYSGRRSRYPPVWQLLGYFVLGIGSVIISFDELDNDKAAENTLLRGRFRPVMRVNWFEKIVYETGGKYAVFGWMLAFGLWCTGFGIWRLWSWLKLRNQS